MNRFSFALLLGFALSAAPAEAQFGRLVNRARDAAERTANQAADHADENASGLAAGVYVARLAAGEVVRTRRVAVAR